MDWLKRKLFGTATPTRAHYALFRLKWGFLLLVMYGTAIDFLAARWLVWGALVPAMYFGATRGGLLYAFNSKEELPSLSLAGEPFLSRVFAFAVVSLTTWIALARGVGGGLTLLAGSATVSPPIVLHAYEAVHRRSGSPCFDQLRGDALDQFQQKYICVNSSYMARHYRKRVEVQLIGYKGVFGFYIRGFKQLRDLGPYTP